MLSRRYYKRLESRTLFYNNVEHTPLTINPKRNNPVAIPTSPIRDSGCVWSRVLERREPRRRRIRGCRSEPRTHLAISDRPSCGLSRDYHPAFISSSLSFVSATILDACSRRGCRWGEIVNDASHGKSGSAGHATPSPGEPLFNGALFMKLDVARPRMYLPMRGQDNAVRLTRRS